VIVIYSSSRSTPISITLAYIWDDGPARQKRGNYRGKKKLFDFQRTVELKEAELAALGQAGGPMEFNKCQQAILKTISSKTLNLEEKEGTEKVSKMMSTYNNRKAPNAHEKIRGEDMPPHLLGYIPYGSLAIQKEQARADDGTQLPQPQIG
jgi:hypothetical protein